MKVKQFVFNVFLENTYVLYDDTLHAVIVDPGCNTPEERSRLTSFIEENGLKISYVINTHCHIDHVLGNKYVCEKYNVPLVAHEGEKVVLQAAHMSSQIYNIDYEESPNIEKECRHGDVLSFGDTALHVLLTPGHSPASLSFYHKESQQLIAGDVLFRESIGRTDLPGGDYDTLIRSIQEHLFTLPEEVVVYPGHGESTTIGYEKRNNPFFR